MADPAPVPLGSGDRRRAEGEDEDEGEGEGDAEDEGEDEDEDDAEGEGVAPVGETLCPPTPDLLAHATRPGARVRRQRSKDDISAHASRRGVGCAMA